MIVNYVCITVNCVLAESHSALFPKLNVVAFKYGRVMFALQRSFYCLSHLNLEDLYVEKQLVSPKLFTCYLLKSMKNRCASLRPSWVALLGRVTRFVSCFAPLYRDGPSNFSIPAFLQGS